VVQNGLIYFFHVPYSRGSLYETKTWLTKAFNRNLIDEKEFQSLIKELDINGKKLNNILILLESPMTGAKRQTDVPQAPAIMGEYHLESS